MSTTEPNNQIKKTSPAVVIIWIVAILFVIGFFYYVSQPSTPNNSTSPSQETTSAQPTTTYSQHASDYMYAYLSALSSLYQSTQRFTNVQTQYGSTGTNSDTNILISLAEIATDLKDAQTSVSPYIDDSNQAIGATAKLLYADIGIEINSVTQMQASYTEGINNQDVTALQNFRTQMVTFAANKSALENDILKALQGVKYVIQNPSDNPNPTGPIDYAISPDNRSFLIKQMGILFPTPLDHAAGQSNIYLFYARVINLFMSSDTYEQQAAVKV